MKSRVVLAAGVVMLFAASLQTTVTAGRRCRLRQEWTCGGVGNSGSAPQASLGSSFSSNRNRNVFKSKAPNIGATSMQKRFDAAKAFIDQIRQANREAGGGGAFNSFLQADAVSSNSPILFNEAVDDSAKCDESFSATVDSAQERHSSFLQPTLRASQRATAARHIRCITELVTTQCGLSLNDFRSFASGGGGGGLNFASDRSGNGLGIDCALVGEAPLTTNCNTGTSERIRTIDGQCNNNQHPTWGANGTQFQRLQEPLYHDQVGEMRIKSQVGGSDLPLGRVISTCTSPLVDIMHPWMSQAGALFGQFITHDLVLTPTTKITGADGKQKPPKCCGTKPECLHEDCFPIPIPADDESFSRVGQTCMEFVRSVPSLHEKCDIGHREQINQETHYLDLSVVYASTKEKSHRLRSFQDGLLAVNTESGSSSELLPADDDKGACKKSENGGHACFLGGDQRTNVQPVLVAYQTIYLRAHNRLARGLKRLADAAGVAYNDESLFQTARKILIAINQHFVYNEFLPVILGQNGINDGSHQLQLCGGSGLSGRSFRSARSTSYCSPDGFYTGYSSSISPQIIHEFSTAAFRLHTLVPDTLNLNDRREHLGDDFFNIKNFYETDAVTNVLGGTSRAPCQYYDQKLVRSLRDELFRAPTNKNGLGLDLLTLNIYRGRDHGISPYNVYRENCGSGRASLWEDLGSTMSPQAITALRCAYQNVEDIDLFAGCIAENPKADGVVGPTAACIISEQFQRTRQGDRFWYENPGQFDQAQLNEIRKLKLSSLICATANVQQTFSHVMLLASRQTGRPIPCANVASMQLEVFLPILKKFSALLGVSQLPPRSTNFHPRPAAVSNPFQSSQPHTTIYRPGGSSYNSGGGYYPPKKATTTFTSYANYFNNRGKAWSKPYGGRSVTTVTRPWAPSTSSYTSTTSASSAYPNSARGSYAHGTSYAGKQFNPYDKLFGYWQPQQWKSSSASYSSSSSSSHASSSPSRYTFRSGCSTCRTYYDAVSDDELKNLTSEKACIGYVERVFDEPKKPKDLAKEITAMQKKDLHDPSPLILQCCYKEFKDKILPKGEAKKLDYPEPTGFEKGKSCKDVVKGLLKLVKNDYEQPPLAQTTEGENKTATSPAVELTARLASNTTQIALPSVSFP